MNYSAYEFWDLVLSACNLFATFAFIYYTVKAIKSTESASRESIMASKKASEVSVRASEEAVKAAQSENSFQLYFQMTTHWLEVLNDLKSPHFSQVEESVQGRKLLNIYYTDIQQLYSAGIEHRFKPLIIEKGIVNRIPEIEELQHEQSSKDRIARYYALNRDQLDLFMNFFRYTLKTAEIDLSVIRSNQLRQFIRSQLTIKEIDLVNLIAETLESETVRNRINFFTRTSMP